MDSASPSATSRAAFALGVAALAAMFVYRTCDFLRIDIDVFQLMALFRETMAEGRVPLVDHFAYTPTVTPLIHHEWGTGAIQYGVSHLLGGAGLVVLHYLLMGVTAFACARAARIAGASWPVTALASALALNFGRIGFTTVRPQVFTLALLAILMCFLALDRRGERRWVWFWPPLHVLWVNTHGGFVLGLGFLGFHFLEQLARRQPVRHLIILLVVLTALVPLNVYGFAYPAFILRITTMSNSNLEWLPLWYLPDPLGLTAAALGLALFAYAALRLGPRRMVGWPILLFVTVAGVKHARHVSLLAVVWLSLVPGYLQQTSLGAWLEALPRWRPRLTLAVAALLFALFGLGSIQEEFWRLRMPINAGDDDPAWTYPIGAVDYLADSQFAGRLATSFRFGGYVTWRLAPAVRVSLDSRYGDAYTEETVGANRTFQDGAEGWRTFLERFPTDAALEPVGSRIEGLLVAEGWTETYRDDLWAVLAHPGVPLPLVDHRGLRFANRFP